MKSQVGKETALSIPIWAAKRARKILDNWVGELDTKVEYKEDNSIIFVTFTFTVWGDARKVNMVTETICNQLRRL